MSNRYRPCTPQQAFLLAELDIAAIERGTHEDVALRVIGGGTHPHWTLNAFRLQHRVALANLFDQVLRMCSRAGLRAVGHVALDGSKVQANASKHKAMSYGRMKRRRSASVPRSSRCFSAGEIDASEDREFGTDKRGDELPEELLRRETRLQRIREVKGELEAEAAESRAAALRENAANLRAKLEDRTVSCLFAGVQRSGRRVGGAARADDRACPRPLRNTTCPFVDS